MVFGYIRISKDSSDTENQRREISNYAQAMLYASVDDIQYLEETVSGAKSASERGLSDFIKKMKKDNVLLVSSLSRLGRNTFDVCETINKIIQKGIRLISIQENREFGDNIESRMFASFYAIFADIERDFIRKRTKAAIDKQKQDATYTGGRPKDIFKEFTPDDIKKLKTVIGRGEYRKKVLSQLVNMSEPIFRRNLRLDKFSEIETLRKAKQVANRDKKSNHLIIEMVDNLPQIAMNLK